MSCPGELRFYIYLNLIPQCCLVIPGLCVWGLFVTFIVSSEAQSYLTLWDPMGCSTPGFPVHHQLPEPTQTHVRRVSDAIQPSHPLSSPSPPAFNLSQHQGLFKESILCIRWWKYWSFSFSISPSSEYSGLISSRIDWLYLLAVQGTFKSQLTCNFYIWDTVMSGIRESLST